jgi:hypothetical protein
MSRSTTSRATRWLAATTLVDRIEAIVAETGQTGFHFVDEAAPPKALKAMAEELKKRGRAISWWGNIRFEKSFTPELCASWPTAAASPSRAASRSPPTACSS